LNPNLDFSFQVCF